ncbi:recombinase family protein [Streptomyces fuscichromogenes]|uniref:recombinase family protein n=1 Tax=Streptomyces fuscichromogenes TaxID=1324013 RepID=UPI0038039454
MITKQPRQEIIYCRISEDREGKEYGVDRQEAHCRRLADRRGWQVVSVLVDNDITGTGGKNRPGYDQLLTMLRKGTANAVLAVSDKRLNRNHRNAFELLDLIQERDIAVEFTKGGPINMNTAEGRGIVRRKAIDAQEESEEIGERVADAKKDNVAKGTYRGGGRPFGYESDGKTPRSLVCPECSATEGFVITVVREDHDDHHTHDEEAPCPIKAVTVACPNDCAAEPVNAPGSEAWHLEQASRGVAAGATNRSELRKWHVAGVKTPARRKRNPDGIRTEPTPGEWTPTTFL